MITPYAAVASVAVAAAATFYRMDCNPSLWLYAALQAPRRTISQQTVWIIGASSGIGKELAAQLVANNNNLILSARNKDKLEAVANECRQIRSNVNIQIHVLDVTNTAALLDASEKIDCDICILNAGQGHLSLASETTPETTASMLHGNALWQMILAPKLRCRHLVVMSSIAAILPVPLSAAYSASKHALQGYFKSMAAEESDRMIDIICPGPVDTDFHSKDENAVKRKSSSSSPLKMSAERCAQLTLATMSRTTSSQRSSTVWLCPQPALTALYLEKMLPSFVFGGLMRRIAAKRIALYRNGLDLYDPNSWKK